MPKVVVSKSKGLVQQTGVGFELKDLSLKPATETCSPQLLALTVTAENANTTLNGKFFDLSSTTADYRFYFHTVGAVDTPPAEEGRELVSISIADDGNIAAVGDAVESAIEAVNAGADFEALDADNDGTILIGGIVIGQSLQAASAGTSGFTVVKEQRGSGQVALSLDKKISILALDPQDIEDAASEELTTLLGQGVGDSFTLANGTYIGQEKVIIRQKTGTETDDISVVIATGYEEAGGNLAQRTATFKATAAKPGILPLIWVGNGWLPMSAGLSAHAAGGVTGLND
jgi:hypothetical protein